MRNPAPSGSAHPPGSASGGTCSRRRPGCRSGPGICSTIRPVSTPKSNTAIFGGWTPMVVRAVQIWLRWSVPCSRVPASRYPTGAHRWNPSLSSTSRTTASGSSGPETSSVHPRPVRSMTPRASESDIRPASTLNARSPVRTNRSNASFSTRWRTVSRIGPRVPAALVSSCSAVRPRQASIRRRVAQTWWANAASRSELLMTNSSPVGSVTPGQATRWMAPRREPTAKSHRIRVVTRAWPRRTMPRRELDGRGQTLKQRKRGDLDERRRGTTRPRARRG